MAKYDWKQLEKEFILGEQKSVSEFLKEKGIPINGNTKKSTKGWKNKKGQKEYKKSTKTIEKVIEKESEVDAQQIVDIKKIANDLALKIEKATLELDKHIATNKKKTRKIEYDYLVNKPNKEIIEEKEEIKSYISIIDRKGLKELSSALKDLNDILTVQKDENKEDKIDQYLTKLESVFKND